MTTKLNVIDEVINIVKNQNNIFVDAKQLEEQINNRELNDLLDKMNYLNSDDVIDIFKADIIEQDDELTKEIDQEQLEDIEDKVMRYGKLYFDNDEIFIEEVQPISVDDFIEQLNLIKYKVNLGKC